MRVLPALTLAFGLLVVTGCGNPTKRGPAVGMAQLMAEQRALGMAQVGVGAVGALDPTPISGMVLGKAQQAMQDKWHESIIERQIADLPPEQREIMRRYMKNPQESDALVADLMQSYGLDENGNPLPQTP